ncbi:hypothetical protein DPMN_098358 [Dreissena polymorpha]|uniref:Uncharacterized protein n=1 Tax=Dreissena polymorpha TaxID=45954 RepID=A0A9D4LDG2_DREPO|nr:hypothetical protein DPMN_098358 [Dreissena polymorpha]
MKNSKYGLKQNNIFRHQIAGVKDTDMATAFEDTRNYPTSSRLSDFVQNKEIRGNFNQASGQLSMPVYWFTTSDSRN